MFDIGMSEMVILLIIGLLAIGPKQLPEVAAKLARTINDLKRLTSDFTDEFTKVRDSTRQTLHDTQSEIQKAIEENPVPREQIADEKPKGDSNGNA